VWFGYITGWRLNEVLSRRWRHVNFELGTAVMEQYETKSGKGRTFPMVDELRQLLQSIRPEKCFPNNLIFQRNRQLIERFDKAWATACYKAGLPVRYIEKKVLIDPKDPAEGKRVVLYKNGPKKGQPIMERRPAIYFHDMRRSAYRNLVRMGTPEGVAQQAIGWEDPDIARRYDIVAQADLDVLRERYDAARNHGDNGSFSARNGARNGARLHQKRAKGV
jgi:integrase